MNRRPFLIFFPTWLTLLAIAWLAGCTTTSSPPGPPAPVLLISLDAFRWDYIARHPGETPHLRRLAQQGVTAKALVPVFPSLTFTSHYSIVTGLYPAHHGIISNRFFDPQLGLNFDYKAGPSVHDPRFWGGEPIWITAVKQGHPSACYFWPGAEVAGKFQPTFNKSFDYTIPFERRLDELIGWLRLPPGQRPVVTVFYLEETNTAGHYHGPDSAEVTAAIKLLDERVGRIADRAAAENIPLNLVIVSDHGMAATDGAKQTTMLDDYIDPAATQVDFDGPIAGLRALDGNVAGLIRRLSALSSHYHVYRAADLPARWHLSGNARIPDVWVVPEPGWRIQRRAAHVATKDATLKGDHGYDNAAESMHGFFLAHGPAFKPGVVVESFENIHLYNLLCAAAGLKPAPNDGDNRLLKSALR